MENQKLYRQLQQHLDKHTLGFAATDSGAELRVLEHIFSPAQARVATCMTHKLEPPATIYARSGHGADSPESLAQLLDDMEQNGAIGVRIQNGQKVYRLIPWVVGMYEGQQGNLTPEFLSACDEYFADRKFGVDMLSTALPQMRTVPVAKTIRPSHHVSSYDEVADLVARAEPPFVILPCICRQKTALEGTACKVTERQETCMAVGDVAKSALRQNRVGRREISREEALSILALNQKEGLVLQPSNTQKAEFFCSCCGCCCGMLNMQKQLPKPVDFWASNFYVAVEAGACIGCGKCVGRCQVDALSLSSAEDKKAVVNLDRCIGCGNCAAICPTGAMSLEKKKKTVTPPATGEELQDIIMNKKKGRLGKLKVTGKIILDAVRTGQTHLLK